MECAEASDPVSEAYALHTNLWERLQQPIFTQELVKITQD